MGGFIRILERKFIDILDSTGFSEYVGGRSALEDGFADLRSGILPVVAEMLQVEERREPLAPAVFDGERYPHLVRVHGWLIDIVDMAIPTELLPWIQRVRGLSSALGDDDIHRILATITFRSPLAAERALGRLALFEILCLNQRIRLRKSHVEVEALGGDADRVESIVEEELAAVASRGEYRNALVSIDDPLSILRVLSGASLARLDAYVQVLRSEVARVGQELADRLRIRQEMLALLAQADPADALLVKNAHAEAFGSERLTVQQLKLRHPGLLREVSPAAARKRLERVLRRRLQPPPARPITLGDLLLEQIKELDR
jgi:hypothetical protein